MDKRMNSSGIEGAFCVSELDFSDVLGKALDRYKKELLESSLYPDSLNLDELKPSDIKKVTFEELKDVRDEFNTSKEQLILEWEKQNGKNWPRHDRVVVKGRVKVKEKGALYDAHHIMPLSWGGENVASNITPMEWTVHHLGVHGKDSGFNKVSDLLNNSDGASFFMQLFWEFTQIGAFRNLPFFLSKMH